MNIHNIPCEIRSERIRRFVSLLLDQIREQSPQEYKRLQKRVSRIVQHDFEDDHKNGSWVWDDEAGPRFEVPGFVRLSSRLDDLNEFSDSDVISVIAHELGHAATTEAEFKDRLPNVLDGKHSFLCEWTSEGCAFWHAYMWGFKNETETYYRRHCLNPNEVGPLPGYYWRGFLRTSSFHLIRDPEFDLSENENNET